jgi:hypothetical protein
MTATTASRRALVVAVMVMTAAVGLGSGAAPVAAYPVAVGGVSHDGACEGELLKLHNASRATEGLPRLREDPSFDVVPRQWAQNLATRKVLSHNPDFSPQIKSLVASWYTMGENVGWSSASVQSLHTAYMNSPGHRANIMRPEFQRIAIGCYRDSEGKIWTSVNFVGSLQQIPERIPTPFYSAGDAVARLRWWTLGKLSTNETLDVETARFLNGQTTVPAYVSSMVASFEHSYMVPSVTRLYTAAFLREPDAGGLNYWIRVGQSGFGLENVATMFTTSAEFQERYGRLDNRAFVDLVYRNVLQRSPDPGGLAYWTDLVNRGMSRGRMLIGFSDSPEFVDKNRADTVVSWASIQLLNRAATPAERLAGTARLNRGVTVAAYVDGIVRGVEFTARAANHKDY